MTLLPLHEGRAGTVWSGGLVEFLFRLWNNNNNNNNNNEPSAFSCFFSLPSSGRCADETRQQFSSCAQCTCATVARRDQTWLAAADPCKKACNMRIIIIIIVMCPARSALLQSLESGDGIPYLKPNASDLCCSDLPLRRLYWLRYRGFAHCLPTNAGTLLRSKVRPIAVQLDITVIQSSDDTYSALLRALLNEVWLCTCSEGAKVRSHDFLTQAVQCSVALAQPLTHSSDGYWKDSKQESKQTDRQATVIFCVGKGKELCNSGPGSSEALRGVRW